MNDRNPDANGVQNVSFKVKLYNDPSTAKYLIKNTIDKRREKHLKMFFSDILKTFFNSKNNNGTTTRVAAKAM